jgi:alcohol dehydrogenase (cytochrome c)
MKTTLWAFGLALLFAPSAIAQTADELANGAADTGNVLNYGMGYSLQRYSPLKQINKDTIKRLVPVWNYSFDDNRSEESQPIVYKGVIYVTSGSATMAVDAKTGKQIWKTKIEFPPETTRVACCGVINRGAAIYDGKLFRTTLDANVIALDAASGKELWRSNAIDFKTGYSMTVAPIVADGVVITGISGGEYGTRDFIDGWDAQTGKHLWRTYTVPGPGEPGNETWPGESWKHGGGATWLTGSFDPELHTVYWGTGNPGSWNAADRSGDNLYTCSVLALDSKTGKIKWHYQFSPNDPFDYDAVAEPVLATINVNGAPAQGSDAGEQEWLLLRARSQQWKTHRRQSVREGELGLRHRFGDLPADLHRRKQEGARRREGHGVAFDAGRQELGADVVQSADRNRLRQHAEFRRALPGGSGGVQGR